MKKTLLVGMSICIIYSFNACSGKVQTNKIPNNTKYHIPKNQKKEQANTLDSKELQSYSIALEEFFKRKTQDDEEKKQDIYQIGIEKGYFR